LGFQTQAPITTARQLTQAHLAQSTYLEIRVASSLDVAVHVDLVVVKLMVLHDETFEGSVLIALEHAHQILCRRVRFFFFFLRDQSCTISKRDRFIRHKQTVLVNLSIDVQLLEFNRF